MPRITNENVNEIRTPEGYEYSGVNVEDVEASEYTLGVIVQDDSGSVEDFKEEMTECLKTILSSSQKSERAANMMIRLVSFSDTIHEVHGFRNLQEIDPSEYDKGVFVRGYSTALFDVTHSSISTAFDYAKKLVDFGVQVNIVIFIITDGMDNVSKRSPKHIKEMIKEAKQNEDVESIQIVLIGVNTGSQDISNYLEKFKDEAGIDQFIDINKADKGSLAKLAGFVSQSLSSASQQLSGGTSTPAVW